MSIIDENVFKSNTNKEKEAEEDKKTKKIQPVVSSPVKTRKKSLSQKISSTFIKEDKQSVKNYLLFDVIIPSVKDTIVDLVTNGINMLLFGETGKRRSRSSTKTIGSKISYSSYYKDSDDRRCRSVKDDVSDIDDLLFDTRAEAQDVLNALADIIDEYDAASVADLYDLCGVTESYTDHKYGWTDVSRASVKSVRGGYFVIDLPRPRPIK